MRGEPIAERLLGNMPLFQHARDAGELCGVRGDERFELLKSGGGERGRVQADGPEAARFFNRLPELLRNPGAAEAAVWARREPVGDE